MCWLTLQVFRRSAAEIAGGLVFFGGLQLVLMMLFGTAIGLMGSMLSVGRHLRHV
jgi:hypothetical protein